MQVRKRSCDVKATQNECSSSKSCDVEIGVMQKQGQEIHENPQMLRKNKVSPEIRTQKVKACREIIKKKKKQRNNKKKTCTHQRHRKSKQERENNLRNIEE